ncbi:glycosyltransferase family 39 protein [Emticicia oligotrophica]|uniref:glycosyltransferase family 39 protein n=1 Tax=Emticicia oligotrophica TaxID=312279 RepID=UPI00273C1CDD|nr:glycosyltransferase family 39 protein [Emticicia oligotrophica]
MHSIKTTNKNTLLHLGVLLLITPIFGLFSYNSGFGYDALEYLVIGRSLNDGYQMYDFIPSKSWFWYVFVQKSINLLGGNFTHFTVTILIVLEFIGIGLSSYVVINKLTKHTQTAFISAFLSLLCCFFMEINFLEPEAPIAILAMWSLYFLAKNKNLDWFIGGVMLGIAMTFKSIAMFYIAGAGIYLFYECFFIKKTTFWQITQKGTLILAGFAVPLLLSILYFYQLNRLDQHIYWSYIYPFGSYPAHTIFLKKLLIKTFWFILLTIVSIVLALSVKDKSKYWSNTTFMVSLFFGIFSLASLMKSQASHYFYPAAPFFSVVIAMVYTHFSKIYEQKLNRVYLAIGGLSVLVLTITFITRREVVQRLAKIDDFAIEKTYESTVNRNLKTGDKALLIDFGSLFYFHSHRYPNVPFINTEMQTSDYIKTHTDVYEKSLQDTTLKLVIFGFRSTVIDDSSKVNTPENKIALDKLRQELNKNFTVETDSVLFIKLWHRKSTK